MKVYKWLCSRYTVAGVFSRCLLDSSDCCIDPVVYTRTTADLKHWIRKHAPGVRDSNGCPKKVVIGLLLEQIFQIKYVAKFLKHLVTLRVGTFQYVTYSLFRCW